MKKVAFGFILGIIVCFIVSAIAETLSSNEVLYDNSSSHSNVDNVQDALDDLYNIYDHSSSGFSLLTHTPTGLSTELVGGLYRYQGNNVNNYICFGTTDKSNCTTNKDIFLYRIIGIDESGKIKLIKREPLPNKYQRHTVYGSVDLPATNLFNLLNGEIFLDNTTYVPDNTWKNRIATTTWKYADNNNIRKTAEEIYSDTLAFEGSIDAKIGLMYLYDFYYGMPGNNNCFVDYVNCRKSWIFLSNNGPYSADYEWTIQYYSNCGWVIKSSGEPGGYENRNSQYVRPVFSLNIHQIIASGSGTLDDPYILGD